MTAIQHMGFWTIDVEISPEIYAADIAILGDLMKDWPEEVSVREMEVIVNGRIWRWQKGAYIGDLGSWDR